MSGKQYNILVLNLGSTSTKVGIYVNETPLVRESINHPRDEIDNFTKVADQYDYRLQAITDFLARQNRTFADFDIFVCRGGNVRPVPGGIYMLTEEMLTDIYSGKYGTHPNCIGNKIIYEQGKKLGKPAIFVDPPVTDELCDEARLTGLPDITRLSSGHALNQKATARKIAAEMGTDYTKINIIVCHLGGGISIGAHRQGKIIDMNNSLDGDGPMGPERAGTLPTGSLVDMCFSNKFTHAQMRKRLTGGGGWMAHLGMSDGRELIKRVTNGDPKACQVFNATMYQVCKEIGAAATVLRGDFMGIALTGSLVYSQEIVQEIKNRTAFLGVPYFIKPGENEMEALNAGALRYLRGEEQLAPY